MHVCPDTKEEYWSTRTLMELLGYTKWGNFIVAIERAMDTCQGTISPGVYTGSVKTKRLAMQSATSEAVMAGVNNPGTLLPIPHLVVINIPYSINRLLPNVELEYLICGYITRHLNDACVSDIGDNIEGTGLSVDLPMLRSEIIETFKYVDNIPVGYSVVERCNVNGIFINVYE